MRPFSSKLDNHWPVVASITQNHVSRAKVKIWTSVPDASGLLTPLPP